MLGLKMRPKSKCNESTPMSQTLCFSCSYKGFFDSFLSKKIKINLSFENFDFCEIPDVPSFYEKGDDTICLFFRKFLARASLWSFVLVFLLCVRFVTGRGFHKKLLIFTTIFSKIFLSTTTGMIFSIKVSSHTSVWWRLFNIKLIICVPSFRFLILRKMMKSLTYPFIGIFFSRTIGLNFFIKFSFDSFLSAEPSSN